MRHAGTARRRERRTRLPNSAHDAHHWVIAQIAPDFRLLDVWALPAEGGRNDFDDFLAVLASLDPGAAGSAASRALFWVRYRLGDWFGWDETEARPIPGCTETTLSARLPQQLRGSADRSALGAAVASRAGGFVPLYRTDDEWAAEISNGTVHAVLHVAWVARGTGRYRAEMGVYVKPRGAVGKAYLLLIDPFRHLIVYPALMRQIGRAWQGRDGPGPTAVAGSPASQEDS